MKVPISKIGDVQRVDIERSSGLVLYDDMGRICTVVKDKWSHDNRGDKSPQRMADLFGGQWQDFNNHFIVQLAGCPLACPYCYVDNLKADFWLDADDLVEKFIWFRNTTEKRFGVPLNVFHCMGGAPARYPQFWTELRESLDSHGLQSAVLFSDVILVENYFYGVKPWEYLGLHNFLLTGCLKGTNRDNFLENTGRDLFEQSLGELRHYLHAPNFYLTLIGYDPKDLGSIFKLVSEGRIDFLTIVNYEVTKRRKKKSQIKKAAK